MRIDTEMCGCRHEMKDFSSENYLLGKKLYFFNFSFQFMKKFFAQVKTRLQGSVSTIEMVFTSMLGECHLHVGLCCYVKSILGEKNPSLSKRKWMILKLTSGTSASPKFLDVNIHSIQKHLQGWQQGNVSLTNKLLFAVFPLLWKVHLSRKVKIVLNEMKYQWNWFLCLLSHEPCKKLI